MPVSFVDALTLVLDGSNFGDASTFTAYGCAISGLYPSDLLIKVNGSLERENLCVQIDRS